MTGLDKHEADAIRRACMRRGRVHAIAAYGSRVAGYYKEGSDYDVLLALEGFKERVRYLYEKFEGLNLSILMVDKDALLGDAERAELGEFVAGRLLNPYLPLSGERFWREVELKLKKRVVMEELGELADEFGTMALYIYIPIRYILFSKLKKRATIYPPALYSYAMTYSGERAEANLARSLEGFEHVVKGLEEKGVLKTEDEGLRLSEKGLRMLKRPAFKRKVELIGRGIRHYLVHGLAGKVGLDVVFKEAYSKAARSFYKVPEELKEPKSLLSLVEGLFVTSGDWLSRLIEHLGFKGRVEVDMKPLGSFYSTTHLYRLKSKGAEARVVVKRFLDFWSVKWLLVSMVAKPARNFGIKPSTRMSNEYTATIELRKAGVGTPKVLLVHSKEKLIVKEFVDGIPSTKFLRREEVVSVARALSSIHKMGYAVGDTKPDNILFKGDDVYFVDLEQAEKGGDPVWDVAEFIYYSCWFLPDTKSVKELVERFAEGYGHDRSILRKAASEKYALPFRSVTEIDMLSAAKKALRSIS